MIIEIKLDKNTLPDNGQKVQWQTYKDVNEDRWKSGVYTEFEEDQTFIYCDGKFDFAWEVLHWKKIENQNFTNQI